MKRPPHSIQVIGISGPRDAGKDTVGQLLATHAGFTPLAFADALYHEIATAYQVDVATLQQRETKETPLRMLALSRCLDADFVASIALHYQRQGEIVALDAPCSPRQILRWWAETYRCARDPKYWTRRLAARVTDAFRMCIAERFAITDVSKPLEADLVRSWGGLLWQVKRPGREHAVGEYFTEVSGAEFGPDTVINNAHDERHLQQQVLAAWWGHDAGLQGRVQVKVLP